MKKIGLILLGICLLLGNISVKAQEPVSTVNGWAVKSCVDKGDTIPYIQMRPVYVFSPFKFKNKRQVMRYNKLVRNVKKTLPIAKMIRKTVDETYEHLQTLPTKKEQKKYIKQMEKELKRKYTPMMKKLTFSQGKLLIRLVDRECNKSSYELVKSFMGSFKAGFYQAFASLFGASLKKEYDPEDEDKMTERVIILVENGQL